MPGPCPHAPHERTGGVESEVLARAACGRRAGWGVQVPPSAAGAGAGAALRSSRSGRAGQGQMGIALLFWHGIKQQKYLHQGPIPCFRSLPPGFPSSSTLHHHRKRLRAVIRLAQRPLPSFLPFTHPALSRSSIHPSCLSRPRRWPGEIVTRNLDRSLRGPISLTRRRTHARTSHSVFHAHSLSLAAAAAALHLSPSLPSPPLSSLYFFYFLRFPTPPSVFRIFRSIGFCPLPTAEKDGQTNSQASEAAKTPKSGE